MSEKKENNGGINIYYCTWKESQHSGVIETGADMLPAESKEQAEEKLIDRHVKKRRNATEIKVYDFSKICDEYNIKYELPEVKKEKKGDKPEGVKPEPIEHDNEENDGSDEEEEEIF